MTLTRMDWIFFGFAVLIGAAAGGLYVFVPQSRTMAVSPYFWVLVAIALFEAAVMYLRGFERGPPLTMPNRIAGFCVAVGLLLVVKYSVGVE